MIVLVVSYVKDIIIICFLRFFRVHIKRLNKIKTILLFVCFCIHCLFIVWLLLHVICSVASQDIHVFCKVNNCKVRSQEYIVAVSALF